MLPEGIDHWRNYKYRMQREMTDETEKVRRYQILVLKNHTRNSGLHPKGTGIPTEGLYSGHVREDNTQITSVFSKVHSNCKMENGVLGQ